MEKQQFILMFNFEVLQRAGFNVLPLFLFQLEVFCWSASEWAMRNMNSVTKRFEITFAVTDVEYLKMSHCFVCYWALY